MKRVQYPDPNRPLSPSWEDAGPACPKCGQEMARHIVQYPGRDGGARPDLCPRRRRKA
jgi:hypothetical protein